eukprot:1012177-Pleurochrysis_carterae.AAC.6
MPSRPESLLSTRCTQRSLESLRACESSCGAPASVSFFTIARAGTSHTPVGVLILARSSLIEGPRSSSAYG